MTTRQIAPRLSLVALLAIAVACGGGTLDDAVKLTVFLADLGNFGKLNEIMAGYFSEPHPARSAVGVSQLPRGALIEIDAVLVR